MKKIIDITQSFDTTNNQIIISKTYENQSIDVEYINLNAIYLDHNASAQLSKLETKIKYITEENLIYRLYFQDKLTKQQVSGMIDIKNNNPELFKPLLEGTLINNLKNE